MTENGERRTENGERETGNGKLLVFRSQISAFSFSKLYTKN